MSDLTSERHAWFVIAASTVALFVGTLLLWSDVICNKLFSSKINLLKNRSFLVLSLCLSSGLLMSTALNSLLPKALNYIVLSERFGDEGQNISILLSFAVGVVICMGLNFIIHMLTAQSIVHCAHEDTGHTHDDDLASISSQSGFESIASSSRNSQHGAQSNTQENDHSSLYAVRRGLSTQPRCTLPKNTQNEESDTLTSAPLFSSKCCKNYGTGCTNSGNAPAPSNNSSLPSKHAADDPSEYEIDFTTVANQPASVSLSDRPETRHSHNSRHNHHDSHQQHHQHQHNSHRGHELHHHSSHPHLRQHFSIPMSDVEQNATMPRMSRTRSLLDRTSSMFRPSYKESIGSCHGFQTLVSCADETHREHCCCQGKDRYMSLPPEIYYDAETPSGRDSCRHNQSVDHHDSHGRTGHGHSHDDEALEPHHHHVVSQFGELFSIGLQTTLAISLHKIPEGFLLFATDREDQELGTSLFLALFVHNFLEGFTMASPLYLAFSSRSLAALCTCLLGGGAQPVGALLAQMILPKGGLSDSSFYAFGLLISATAGFMAVISLQMLVTAVKFGGSQNQVTGWSLVGMLIMLGVKCI